MNITERYKYIMSRITQDQLAESAFQIHYGLEAHRVRLLHYANKDKQAFKKFSEIFNYLFAEKATQKEFLKYMQLYDNELVTNMSELYTKLQGDKLC